MKLDNIVITQETKELGVRLIGEIDLYNVSGVKEKILKAMADPYDRVKIDCMDMNHIDSSGLAMIMWLRKILNTANKEMRIVNLNDDCKSVMILCGLDKYLPIEAG